jgi:hypothetical protein
VGRRKLLHGLSDHPGPLNLISLSGQRQSRLIGLSEQEFLSMSLDHALEHRHVVAFQ